MYFFGSIMIGLVIISIAYYIASIYIWGPDMLLSQIIYTPNTKATYLPASLQETLNDNIVNKNYYSFLWNRSNLRSQIQKDYKIIKNINSRKIGNNLKIDIEYHNPSLIIYIDKYKIGYISGSFFQIDTSSKLSGSIFVNIDSLGYTGTSYISGDQVLLDHLFYNITDHQLIGQIDIIRRSFVDAEIKYIPGGHQVVVSYQGKIIYIDIQKNIYKQISKYRAIQKYIKGANKFTIYDLASIDDITYIK